MCSCVCPVQGTYTVWSACVPVCAMYRELTQYGQHVFLCVPCTGNLHSMVSMCSCVCPVQGTYTIWSACVPVCALYRELTQYGQHVFLCVPCTGNLHIHTLESFVF